MFCGDSSSCRGRCAHSRPLQRELAAFRVSEDAVFRGEAAGIFGFDFIFF